MKRCAALLLFAACVAAPPPARVTLPPAGVARAAPPVTPPLPETCEAFEERMRAEMASSLAALPPLYPGVGPVAPSSPVGFCRRTPHGSWRVEMPRPDPEIRSRDALVYAIEARFVVVHLDAGGRRAEHVMKEMLSDYGGREGREPVVFDWDGDGEPELYLEIHEEGDEGHRARQIEILTFRDGAVALYDPASGLDVDGIDDVDHDGRPDLVVFAGYGDALEACFSGFPWDHPPPRFVAHALPDGSFSLEDGAAQAYARSWCPRPPRAVTDSASALCARLWAGKPADVARQRRRVAASCTGGYCDREVNHRPQPADATEDCERRQSWFAKAPPLTL
jgi:hypothetical protein